MEKEGAVIMGVLPNQDCDLLRVNTDGKVMASLDAEEVEKVAQRVVELLYERNRRGERR